MAGLFNPQAFEQLKGQMAMQGRANELEGFREHLRDYDGGRDAACADLSDDVLLRAIDGAKEWIRGRRWSWNIVAANYLRDGRFHAGR